MQTIFNFQINPDGNRKPWQQVTAETKPFADRVAAVLYARKLARIFNAEVRLTQGEDPLKASGAYFRHDDV